MASGPYGFLFATLYQYYRNVPVVYKFRVLGVTVSDKVFLYLLSAQLLWSSFPSSVAAGLCGLLIGALYHHLEDDSALRTWRLPSFLSRFASKYFLPLLASGPVVSRGSATTMQDLNMNNSRNGSVRAGGARAARGGAGAAAGAAGAAPAPVVPSEDAIELLVGMGFPRERVWEALRTSNNDVNRAVAVLLGAQ
ncbi:hypothetical protein HK102_010990 [Quaeritorhiza haematococci]|nr:hypothetical protein HK102_010990 [Quaeritorhiza haematococci]